MLLKLRHAKQGFSLGMVDVEVSLSAAGALQTVAENGYPADASAHPFEHRLASFLQELEAEVGRRESHVCPRD